MERKEEDEEDEGELRVHEEAEEEQTSRLVERLDGNRATRKEKEQKKEQKGGESRAEKATRKEEEGKEEKAREALVQAEALKPDKEILINIGVKKVSCTESVLRNEHKSLLYQKALKAQEGHELSFLMTEATWNFIFQWLLS